MLVDVWLLVVGLSVCLLLVACYVVDMWLFGVVVVLFGCVCGIGDVFGMYCVLVGVWYECMVGWLSVWYVWCDGCCLVVLVVVCCGCWCCCWCYWC